MINSLSLVPLIAGTAYLGIGLISRSFPPKTINSLYGYRTIASMRNADTWKTANDYSPKMMASCGAGQLLFGLAALMLPQAGKIGPVIGIIIMLSCVFYSFRKTEKHVKNSLIQKGIKNKSEYALR